MKRRHFLRRAGSAAAASVAALGLGACQDKQGATAAPAAPAVHADAAVRWRMTSSFPKSLDILFRNAEHFTQRLRELTDGRFDIRVFPAGEIVPGLQALDAVQQGTVEMTHTCSYYYVGKDKTFGFGTSMPFGMNARQMNAWVYFGGGQALLDEFYASYGIVSFPAGSTGVQMGGWWRKPIHSLSDLQGVKMRIAGIGGAVMEKLGVLPQQLAGGDIYPALEKGTIDAAELVGPYDDEKTGLFQVAKHYYTPGWWEPGPMIHFFVGRKAWEGLSKAYQDAFRVAAAEANLLTTAEYDHGNPLAMARLLQQGVKLERYPEEVLKAAHEATLAFYAEESGRNPAFAKLHESWNRYRKNQNSWFSVAETPLDRFMQSRG